MKPFSTKSSSAQAFMNFSLFTFINFLLFTFNCSATTTEQQAKELLNKQNEKGLLDNQGQMMDMEGNPVPFVLFKTEAPGVSLWITEQGMTTQTLQIRKEPLTGKELEDWEAAGGELSGRKKTKKFIDWERIDLTLKGATIKKENISKENPMQGHTNYFYPHCSDGIYGVKEYQKVTIQNVYPNIDWVIYRTPDHHFKYDFVVHPGGDYHQIELIYHSKTPIHINEQGQLAFTTNYGNLQENKPVSFYEGKEVTTQFIQNYQQATTINEDNGYETSIGFKIDSTFNTELSFEQAIQHSTLIIDPELVWGTLYGGNGLDGFTSMDVDNNDNLFITGYNSSTNFPTQNAGTFFRGTFSGGGVFGDAFILKFDNAGNRLWATYYGGSGIDGGYSITTDNSGNVFVTGCTGSANFPTQSAGSFFQGTFGGGGTSGDAFILKFDNVGNRLWATYCGGSGNDCGYSISTDNLGNLLVTGSTFSANFPTQNTSTFFQGTLGGVSDVFILKFDNAGNQLWGTYYGGSGIDGGYSITTDNSGNVFVTGNTGSTNFPTQNTGAFFQGALGGVNDAFILKFDNAGNQLWGTYCGGSGTDFGNGIITDNMGNVFVMGPTGSANFPTQSTGTFIQGTLGGGRDAFILKFDNAGNQLWGTYYGGSGYEYMSEYDNIAIDQCNNVYIRFYTDSPNMTTMNACGINSFNDATYDGVDAFISKFDNMGNLLWASYIGGAAAETRSPLAVDSKNNLFMGGEFNGYATSTGLPMFDPGGGAYFDNTPNGSEDSYILKFAPILPTFTQTQLNSTACTPCNGEATAIINYCSSPPFSYAWSTGSQTLNTTDTFNILTGLCAGNYWVEISSGCNQADTLFFTITGSTASTSIQNLTICQGDSVVAGTSVYTTTGAYIDTLFGAAANGCDSLVTLNLTMNPAPQLTLIKADDNCGKQIGSVTAIATSNNPPITYTWNTGSSDSVINNLPTGTYSVIINDGTGCAKTDTIDIAELQLDCDFFVYTPNAFTPNGDGLNEIFLPIEVGPESREYELLIFDRWGNLIFQTSNPNEGWNGKANHGNQLAQIDIYVWKLNYTSLDNSSHKLIGHVTLMK